VANSDLAEVWARSLDGLADLQIQPHQRAWLKLTRPLGLVENTALIATPNEFVKEQLETRLRALVTQALSQQLGRDIQLAVTVDPAPQATMPGSGPRQDLGPETPEPPAPRLQGVGLQGMGLHGVQGLAGPQVADGDLGPPPAAPHSHPAHDGGMHNAGEHARQDQGRPGGPSGIQPAARLGGTRLNSKYTFETFVIGSSNRFAHAAAVAVAEAPAKAYNPLFIYGDSGLGKTHLLHAIGHYAQTLYSGLKVRYVSSEEFTNDFINMIRDGKQDGFRRRYRDVDVLLVDDIQFLENKEGTQEEFFHTFNTLYTAQKPIILSSDSPPRSIAGLEERLRSRFEWGLIADLSPPELETKIVILRRKAEARGQTLPDDVALFLAQQVRSNVRELEGLLNRVLAFSQLTGRPLSLELAKETLRDILPEADRRVSSTDVIKFVARHYGLKVSEIKSKSNQKQIAFPRQVAMWMCKRLTELSYPDIGRQFNDKHHSTVMYSVEKIDKMRDLDADFAQTLDRMVQHFA
jgi:chromosomal replication initiator protein